MDESQKAVEEAEDAVVQAEESGDGDDGTDDEIHDNVPDDDTGDDYKEDDFGDDDEDDDDDPKYDFGQDNPWYMAGTEKTGQYVVVARTHLGRVGYRKLDNSARVRIEPIDDQVAQNLTKHFGGWKPYGSNGQPRFSTVVEWGEATAIALSTALQALDAKMSLSLEINPNAPKWARALVKNPVFAPTPAPPKGIKGFVQKVIAKFSAHK